jgi:ankyrin repeat protein
MCKAFQEVNASIGGTPFSQTLLQASSLGKGNCKALQLAMKRGADLEYVNVKKRDTGDHFTVLGSAAGNVAIRLKYLKLLLDLGANMNAVQAAEGGTPLLSTAVSGRVDVAELLLDHGALINSRLVNGGSALICASTHRHVALVSLLLSRGADVDAANNLGLTSLSYASTNMSGDGGCLPMVNILLTAGANANLKDTQGSTVLHITIGTGSKIGIVKALVAASTPAFIDNMGGSPISMWHFAGNSIFLKTLLYFSTKFPHGSFPLQRDHRTLQLTARGSS